MVYEGGGFRKSRWRNGDMKQRKEGSQNRPIVNQQLPDIVNPGSDPRGPQGENMEHLALPRIKESGNLLTTPVTL